MMQLLALVSQTVFYGSEWAGGGGYCWGGERKGNNFQQKSFWSM